MKKGAVLVAAVALALGVGIGAWLADRSAPADLAEALRAIPVAAVETGSGRIVGCVRRKDGEPVVGAKMTARRHYSEVEDPDPDADVVAEVRREYARIVWCRAYTFETATGRDGAFVFESLPDGEYALRAEAARFKILPASGNAWQVRPGETVDFVAELSAGVDVDVRLAGGARANRVELRFEGVDHPTVHSHPWSPDWRRVETEPGLWRVSASTQDPPARSESVLVDTREGAAKVVLQLRPRRAIHGRLRFAGERLNGVEVSVEPEAHDESPDDEVYLFTDLEPGRYALRARLEGRLLAEKHVDVASAPVCCDLEIPPPDLARFLRIRALGPDGEPVRELEAVGERVAPGRTRVSGLPLTRRKDGTYLAPHPAHEGDVPERRRIVVSWRGCRRQLDYDPGGRRQVELHFRAPAHLRLRLDPGDRADGARFALSVGGTERWAYGLDWRNAAAGAETVLGPVESGEQLLYVAIPAQRADRPRIEFALRTVELTPGENRLTVAVPALHPLQVHCPDVRGSGGVVAQRLALPLLDPRWVSIGPDGLAVIPGLPAGRYRLHLDTGVDIGAVEVDVPAEDVVRLESRAANAVRVVITDPQGTLGALGLENGDLIVAARGQELGEQALWSLLSERTDGESATIVVLRDGRRRELSVALADLRAFPDEAGGELVPALR